MIELNKIVLREIRVKKADRHQVLNRTALHGIVESIKKQRGDLYEKATVLLTEMVRRHPFVSGVRRTALAATISFLEMNGETVRLKPDPNVLQGIREGFYTRGEIKHWLRGYEIRKFERS